MIEEGFTAGVLLHEKGAIMPFHDVASVVALTASGPKSPFLVGLVVVLVFIVLLVTLFKKRR